MAKQGSERKEIFALKVRQWLPAWSAVEWNKKEHRSEPQHWFYQFSISAGYLKALSGIYARTTKERLRGSDDLGIQRRHETERSEEIARFIQFGYPWSDLSKSKRQLPEYNDLRKPGWLPTALVVNILTGTDTRRGKKVHPDDLIDVKEDANGLTRLSLPEKFTGKTWSPKDVPPIEVIDGQHRLWAFEDADLPEDFELPVVGFKGLDLSWQAYLFYTINIKPKKINASLAFDLYPLLRTEEWLSKFEGHAIYRETRAQELVDLLWSHPKSPWHKRINMLGEAGHKGTMVSQAAWIRSLLATFIKSREGKGKRLGGLFGAPVGISLLTPPWSRAEQGALLIFLGTHFKSAVGENKSEWAASLRKQPRVAGFSPTIDLAFFGTNSLLNQDQGVRALLYVANDVLYLCADQLSLGMWGGTTVEGSDESAVSEAIRSLEKRGDIAKFVEKMMNKLASYDWRASSSPDLTPEQALLKAAFRGSGGYRELRRHVLEHVSSGTDDIAKAADIALKALA